MRKLGLSADEVCEIGKWKGVEAFAAHYQRLGAQENLEDKVLHALASKGVHSQTSPRGSAEHEVSRTPPRRTERGGRDSEGEEQKPCEPTRPAQKRSRSAQSASESRAGGSPPPGSRRRHRVGQLRQKGGTKGEKPNQKLINKGRQNKA